MLNYNSIKSLIDSLIKSFYLIKSLFLRILACFAVYLIYDPMKAIIDYIKQTIQLPHLAFQPSITAFNSCSEPIQRHANRSFFVAKEFSKQASYFFRVDSSQEYAAEPEVVEKERKQLPTIDLNYSVGLKRVGKIIIFPLVFCWIILETAFEFIVDSDEDEVTVKQEKISEVVKGNSYQKPA